MLVKNTVFSTFSCITAYLLVHTDPNTPKYIGTPMITTEYFTLAIIVMALITFSVRYVFFTTHFRISLTKPMKNILTFTAPCVLTAMLVPIMFQDVLNPEQTQQLAQSLTIQAYVSQLLSSSYFWAGIFAIIASLFIRQTLLVVILSMLVFYGLRAFIL